MNNAIRQRQRILRVREIEHKAAAMRLSQADATLTNLRQIALRLQGLKQTLDASVPSMHGQMLNAMAEMSERIDDAHASLATPIDNARRDRSRVEAERHFARMREEGVGQMLSRATLLHDQEVDRRTDANRPWGGRRPTRQEAAR